MVLAQMLPGAGTSPDGCKSRVRLSVPRGHGDLSACKEKHQKNENRKKKGSLLMFPPAAGGRERSAPLCSVLPGLPIPGDSGARHRRTLPIPATSTGGEKRKKPQIWKAGD